MNLCCIWLFISIHKFMKSNANVKKKKMPMTKYNLYCMPTKWHNKDHTYLTEMKFKRSRKVRNLALH